MSMGENERGKEYLRDRETEKRGTVRVRGRGKVDG